MLLSGGLTIALEVKTLLITACDLESGELTPFRRHIIALRDQSYSRDDGDQLTRHLEDVKGSRLGSRRRKTQLQATVVDNAVYINPDGGVTGYGYKPFL